MVPKTDVVYKGYFTNMSLPLTRKTVSQQLYNV